MLAKSWSEYIAVIVGTRPEIIKLAPVLHLLGHDARLMHTRQHVDEELSGVFLAGAGLRCDVLLDSNCGVPRHQQVGRMIEALGDLFAERRPAAVVVQGDTNTASAGAQAASYTGIPVLHVEAGLRSGDRTTPEEINTCLAGVLADVHCAPTPAAVANLRAEGVPASRIELTGNTIVEATLAMTPDEPECRAIAAGFGAEPGGYVLATVHRPENTDDPARLGALLDELAKLGLPVLLPLHPRTRLAAGRHGLAAALDRLHVLPPAGHRTFLALARLAALIVSDSGGVQEEVTVLKKPVVVPRNATERPESVEAGFAYLVQPGPQVGETGRRLIADERLAARLAALPCPYGDGQASARIAALARRFLP
jgi:UDP-N-acetylglucosamine 2-epimerase (non-hydrolysing)